MKRTSSLRVKSLRAVAQINYVKSMLRQAQNDNDICHPELVEGY